MKKFIVVLSLFLLGCPTVPAPTPTPAPQSSTSGSVTPPVPSVSASAPNPAPAPTPAPSETALPGSPIPDPEPVVLNWEVFDLNLKKKTEDKNLCLMIYFGTDENCEACDYIEKEYFGNKLFVDTVNKAFLSARFPAKEFMAALPEIGIKKLPSIVFNSTDKTNKSFIVTGIDSPEAMVKVVENFSFYQECVDNLSR
jgi:hypothetical protein